MNILQIRKGAPWSYDSNGGGCGLVISILSLCV